jgi:HSP20 family protein
MPMDLYRSGDHYVLHADLPGVDPDSVDVSVDGGILTVTAQRSERTEQDVQWLSSEPRRIEITPGAREETKVIEPSDSSDQHTTT